MGVAWVCVSVAGSACATRRIRAPRSELLVAGHPTVGTAHVMLEAGRVRPRNGRVVQYGGVSRVNLAAEDAGAGRCITLDLTPTTVTLLSRRPARRPFMLDGYTGIGPLAGSLVDRAFSRISIRTGDDPPHRQTAIVKAINSFCLVTP
jgi:hypothetical protein